MERLNVLIKEDEGVDLIEYAFLAGLLSLVCFTVLSSVGTNLNGLFDSLKSKIASVLP